jgi:hypothetical protein
MEKYFYLIIALVGFSLHQVEAIELNLPRVILEEDIMTTNWEDYIRPLGAQLTDFRTPDPVLLALHSHYRLFQHIKDGRGKLGNDALLIIPEEFKSIINQIVGRIFIIDANGELSSGSGMLIYQNDKLYILTCKHNFKNPENCFFYFVPSACLNPKTGFYDGLASQEHLKYILYALSQMEKSSVQRIHANQLIKEDNSPLNVNSLEVRDEAFRDEIILCSYNKLISEKVFDFLKDNVIFMKKNKVEEFYLEGDNKENYYAIGFPFLDTLYAESKDIWSKEKDFACLAPLIVTRADSIIISRQHQAPTAKGMSGGPLLSFSGNKIKILGVIQGGKLNIDYFLTFN